MIKLIRIDSEPVDPAHGYGFVPPPAPGRSTLAIAELMMTVVLTVGILIAATVVSYGVARTDMARSATVGVNIAAAATMVTNQRAGI